MPKRSRSGPGEHAAAGGGADDREFLEWEADGARRHSLAENDVDPEVFHDRVDEFLDGAGQPMDLVDEEDRALRRVGQEGHDVHLLVEGGPARDVQLDAQLVVQARWRTSSCPDRAGRRRGCGAAARLAFCAAARLISSRSATARWPITSESRCGRSFSSTGIGGVSARQGEMGSSSCVRMDCRLRIALLGCRMRDGGPAFASAQVRAFVCLSTLLDRSLLSYRPH